MNDRAQHGLFRFPRIWLVKGDMQHNRLLQLAIGLPMGIVTAIVAGCAGNELGATVSGTVTLDGSPVGPGVVTFAQTDALGTPATGQLATDGSYYLETANARGLSPGNYQVAVQAFEPPDLAPGERTTEPSKPLVPKRYMKLATSGLVVEVEPGHNSIDIPLTSP